VAVAPKDLLSLKSGVKPVREILLGNSRILPSGVTAVRLKSELVRYGVPPAYILSSMYSVAIEIFIKGPVVILLFTGHCFVLYKRPRHRNDNRPLFEGAACFM
jgi:hypothetical protein